MVGASLSEFGRCVLTSRDQTVRGPRRASLDRPSGSCGSTGGARVSGLSESRRSLTRLHVLFLQSAKLYLFFFSGFFFVQYCNFLYGG